MDVLAVPLRTKHLRYVTEHFTTSMFI